MGLLEGKVALITGAGAGIGRGIARRFVREGAKVMIGEIHAENLARVLAELRDELGGEVDGQSTDVCKKEDIEGIVDATKRRFGGIDILVNNAFASTPYILLEKKTDEMLDASLHSGLWANWWAMRAVLPHMRERGGGRIINFYSIDADTGAWLHADYNVSKSAIRGLTRSAAAEWGRFNINVNLIAPAAIGEVFKKLAAETPGFAERVASLKPLRRNGEPEEDIAPVVVFLASELSRFVTGVTIPVDGGLHLPGYNSTPADIAALED